mmetsp:Transcript_14738/g.21788  ORF Transcript_14738/g.21788 Transcript_14738/m.21788 type:complete len:140 (-) Transcript_14738:545-964(-)
MSGTNLLLIPTRFIVTIGQLLALCMVSQTLDDNIYASLSDKPTNANYRETKQTTETALYIAYACLALDLFNLICGFSMFSERVNVMQIFSHFWGSVFTSWFIANTWRAHTLWFIVIGSCIPTALVEVWVLISIFHFGTI